MIVRWSAFVYLLAVGCAWGQSPIKEVRVDADILWAGVDRPGDLFVILANGEVQKFDKSGRKIGQHRFDSPPTLLDPLDGVQSFYYFRANRHYGTLSYDFSSVSEQELDPSFAINPWLVCPALRELWILDSADFSIKKTSMNAMTISLESTLKHLPDKRITDYIALREYQNYVFLLDRSSGVHMFNPLGKFVRTLGEKGMAYFNFLGEELYYVSGQNLVFVDLYTGEQRTNLLPLSCTFALLNDDRLFAIKGRTITIHPFQP